MKPISYRNVGLTVSTSGRRFPFLPKCAAPQAKNEKVVSNSKSPKFSIAWFMLAMMVGICVTQLFLLQELNARLRESKLLLEFEQYKTQMNRSSESPLFAPDESDSLIPWQEEILSDNLVI
jgi:hypothetical protein